MSSETMTDDLETLINEYVDLISHDHHKERDCNFSVWRVWTRENGKVHSKWVAAHAGYRMEGYEEECESYDAAVAFHIERLKEAIQSQVEWLDENPDEDWRFDVPFMIVISDEGKEDE